VCLTVKEDALAGTVVAQLSVSDLDTELASSVEYYITEGDPKAQFGVRTTGQVYVARPLDRETQERYSLVVQATDTKYVSTTQVYITVLDANGESTIYWMCKVFLCDLNRYFYLHLPLIFHLQGKRKYFMLIYIK
jgi:hypothetical protein